MNDKDKMITIALIASRTHPYNIGCSKKWYTITLYICDVYYSR